MRSSVSLKDLLTRAAGYCVSTVDLYSRNYSLNTDQIEYRRNYSLNTDYYLIIPIIRLSATFRHFVFPCVYLLVGLFVLYAGIFSSILVRQKRWAENHLFFYENKEETYFLRENEG